MPPLQFPRHVLITGGSRGIGLAIAQLFATKGYRCTLLARNEDALKAAVATLQPLALQPSAPKPSASTQDEPTPGLEFLSDISSTTSSDTPAQSQKLLRHAYIPGDITSLTFWETRSRRSERDIRDDLIDPTFSSTTFGQYLPRPTSRYGASTSRIDVLVNCAGITQSSLFTKTEVDQTSSILRTNLEGMMLGTRFLMRQTYIASPEVNTTRRKLSMTLNKEDQADTYTPSISPVIINLSSLLAVQNGFGTVAYSASKAGILGFTRALAAEYMMHRIRVNAIVPGYIESDMTKDLDAEKLKPRIPLARLGKPEEVAHAALFLAENEYAHNCTLNLDGGLSAM